MSTRSGNPAKKAAAKTAAAKKTAAKKASSPRAAKAVTATRASSVKEAKARSLGVLLPMPSGLVFRVRRVDLQTFIAGGNIPNPLMTIVNEALEKGSAADIEKMIGVDGGQVDAEMVNEMFESVKRVVTESVTEPKIHPVPEDSDERDDDLFYIDEVDEEDMMFIFQYATGGTDDVESFREEAAASLASVAQG